MEAAKHAEVSKEYQFEKIKPEIEKIIDTVVNDKCRNIPQYDPKLGQQWSNEIAEEIVRKSQDQAGKNFKI